MNVKETVREKYGAAARRVKSGGSSCCGSAASSRGCADPITSNLYDANETGNIPEEALLASLGCGNPTALANLHPGETVLDLGSGGGIDVLLSAKRVGPGGKAYGLDMTDEMLALARENQRKAGVDNVDGILSQRDLLDFTLEEFDVLHAGTLLVLARQGQHFVGHVEPVSLSGGPNAPRREENVDAAARSQIEHGLAGIELSQGSRIATTERGQQRLFGNQT